jgi:hypothetical protein
MRRFLLTVLLCAGTALTSAQDAGLEYRVKAAYLFNFTRFVDWPAEAADDAPLTICVATPNPFGAVLADTIRDERVNGRPLQVRVVRQPAGCHVLFIPRGVSHVPFLRTTRDRPVLTVGEAPDFLQHGGIVNFVLEDGKVRFDIDRSAAERANLTISSRLLRLARAAVSGLIPHERRAE